MKNLIFGLCILLCSELTFANGFSAQESVNVALVREMWAEYAEKLDNSKFDIYFTKNFQLVDNNELENYDKFKKEQVVIYNKLKSLKVISIDDLFAKDDKVVGRVAIKLSSKNGRAQTYYMSAMEPMVPFILIIHKLNGIQLEKEKLAGKTADKKSNRLTMHQAKS